MASLIPGYNYDIFISYRQKDNKGDRWVSNFVEALKTELEATFKEDVSVYFDENPHERLQETHHVHPVTSTHETRHGNPELGPQHNQYLYLSRLLLRELLR